MSLFLPYRAVLRAPYARAAFTASLVGRLTYGIVGLSMTLTLTAGDCGYQFAGLVMALFGLTIVLVSPFRAWLVDRHFGLSGMLISPALATAYVLTDSLASPRARNRAGNWVNSGYNGGSSAGTLLSGQLIGRVPLSACLPLLAAPALLAVVPLLRARLTPAAQQAAAPDERTGNPTPPAADPADAGR